MNAFFNGALKLFQVFGYLGAFFFIL